MNVPLGCADQEWITIIQARHHYWTPNCFCCWTIQRTTQWAQTFDVIITYSAHILDVILQGQPLIKLYTERSHRARQRNWSFAHNSSSAADLPSLYRCSNIDWVLSPTYPDLRADHLSETNCSQRLGISRLAQQSQSAQQKRTNNTSSYYRRIDDVIFQINQSHWPVEQEMLKTRQVRAPNLEEPQLATIL